MTNALARLEDAENFYANGRYDDSLNLLGSLVAELPGPDAAVLLARTLQAINMLDGAAEAYEFAAARAIGMEKARYLAKAAQLLARSEQGTNACKLAGLAFELDETNADAACVLLEVQGGDGALAPKLLKALIGSGEQEHIDLAERWLAHDERNPLILDLLEALAKRNPDNPYYRMRRLSRAREHCAYAIIEEEEAKLAAEMAAGDFRFFAGEAPHSNIIWLGDEAMNIKASFHNISLPMSENVRLARHKAPHAWGEKIRIGYLTCDLWDDHATMRLLRRVLELHDRSRFEIKIFCYTPEKFVGFDGGGRKQWDEIISIEKMDNEKAMATMRAANIDILVDLKGHTRDTRSELMNMPIAPVHVQWLGFPGSCVQVDCDYVIGDHYVLPETSKPYYHELFCRLPESYQPNDPDRRSLPDPASRIALGLPQDRVVLAAFNSQRKNTPRTLALWARVLKANPQALLWMMVDGHEARKNTAAQFRKLGIKQKQWMFAPKMSYASHIARVRAADLALDTFPCTGHTTTSDMLWAGLPVLSMRGTNFASRVSESLLNAVHLPQLLSDDEDGFVEMASHYIQNAEERQKLKDHLETNRHTLPLFDAKRFTQHLESAFTTMAERARLGLAPEHFDVKPLPVSRT